MMTLILDASLGRAPVSDGLTKTTELQWRAWLGVRGEGGAWLGPRPAAVAVGPTVTAGPRWRLMARGGGAWSGEVVGRGGHNAG